MIHSDGLSLLANELFSQNGTFLRTYRIRKYRIHLSTFVRKWRTKIDPLFHECITTLGESVDIGEY